MPIIHRYNWPGQYTPMEAQIKTAAFFTRYRRAFCLNDMGTGKTMATLWAYDYLRSIGKAGKMLVVSPLSTLERVWGDEIFRNLSHLNYAVLHGSADRRVKLVKRDEFDIYIVNHDGARSAGVFDALIKRGDIDTIVLDELAVLRNGQTDTFKAIERAVINPKLRVWGLTGTPTPNAPTDAWAQVRLVNRKNVPKYFGAFRNEVMTKTGLYTWVEKENAVDRVLEVMTPAIRFTRSDCVDLPPTTFTERDVVLSAEQTKAYKEMSTKMCTEFNGGRVLAVNQADKISKLVQIVCGATYDKDGQTVFIPAKERMAVVEEIFESTNRKVILFVPFTAALHHVGEVLAKRWAVDVVDGSTKKNDRDEIFARFQHGSVTESKGIVANPRVMAHGLTLTAADTIVWFAPTPSNETFDQANHRIIRTSQRYNTYIIQLSGTKVERNMYDRLRHRQKIQGDVLEGVHMNRD